MRTISTRFAFIILFFSTLNGLIKAQNTYLTNDRYPKWRLGLNMGGTWQTSDLKKNYAGLAGGFNLERILNRRDDAPIGFSLGFRYLSGNSTGYDNTQNKAIKYNKALNGTYNSIAKYDSVPGFFYNNYFTHLAEGDLELKINFPAMEKRTHFIFHVFGGIGITKYKTRINALDDSSHVYDFTKLTPTPSVSNIKSFYNSGSGTFETLADDNSNNGTFVLTPSLGIGVGYRFTKHVALVFEHKVSFPFTNTLDGQQYAVSSPKPLKNDIYHYTAVNLIFTIWGKRHSSYSTNPNTTTTNTVNPVQTDPNVYTNANNQPKPIISVYSPSTNPYTTTNNLQQVTGVAQYVNSSNNLSITVNGYAVNNYTFNPNNGSFSFNTNLMPGSNNINIVASNNAGQDVKSLVINYSIPQNPVIINPGNNELPPKVIITYPGNNYTTNSAAVNVNASISNISNSNNIAISANGYAITNFNYNPYNGSLSFVAPLIQGNNSIIVSAFNSAGNDAQQVFVNYIPQNQTTPVVVPPTEAKPVVSFNNPSSSPFQSITPTFSVTANVTNVSSANQISVQYNGMPVTNFTFNQYGFVNFPVNLNTGSNTVVITGTNSAGSDTKTATINYKEAGFPPIVTIVTPGVNPSTSNTASANVVATVTNINDQSNVSVLVNNTVTPFTYNTGNHSVSILAPLNVGMNTVVITATTNFGSDSKTQKIERKEVAAAVKPAITILNPSQNPFNTNISNIPVLAQALNVTTSKSITVTDATNNPVPFTFDAITHQLTFNSALNEGANTYVITATNTAGSDTKTLTINYTKPTIELPKPPIVTIVNPSSNPFATSDAQTQIKATTINVGSQQEISVLVNGSNSTFTFNNTTKEIEVNATLLMGSNTVVITASNQGGSDTKTQVIDRFEQPRVLLPIVTVINPPTSPFLSPAASYPVTAEVLNVSAASGITVTKGQTTIPFTYDANTHMVTFTANLAAGNATFTIKGTNVAGSDSKTVTLNYIKKDGISNPTLLEKPVVTITNPASPNTTTNTATQLVNATVTNVSQAAQVSVLVNGVAVNNFTFNNGAVSLTANLNAGNNTVTITGTNPIGSDSKTISIEFKKAADESTMEKPVVTFITPALPNTTILSSTQAIAATVTNVINASQVSVKVNGASINNFNFANGNVNFTANLMAGNNTVSITGTNTAGSDTKTITIVYDKRTPIETGIDKPLVTILNPAANSVATNSVQQVTATVTNVMNATQVSVSVNGNPLNNFSFAAGTVTFTTNLIPGTNTITVTGTNAAGSDTKSVTITYNKIAGNTGLEKPIVTILNPASASSTTLNSTQSVVATVTNVLNASQVTVNVNGNALNNFSFTNGNVSFIASLAEGNNTITVTGTNNAGTDSKSVTVIYNKKISGTETMEKPVVTITSPANGTTTIMGTQAVTATITNILNASQASVQVNGNAVNNFTFVNGNIGFTANLINGNNTVTVTGTNVAGSDTKSITIVYNKKESTTTTMEKPVVTITSPANGTTTIMGTQAVTATITNILNASQASVQVNGNAVNNFTFVNGSIGFTANLINGNNTVTVTGTNVAGSDTKSISIVYNKKESTTTTMEKPVVTITNPAAANSVSPGTSLPVNATITNVLNATQVVIKVNGNNITNFTFNSGNVSFTANLNLGSNSITVTGTNSAGSDSKTITVEYNKTNDNSNPNLSPKPVVTITSNNQTTGDAMQTVSANIAFINSASQVSITVNGIQQNAFTYNNGNISFNANLNYGNNSIEVKGTNAAGSDSKTVAIFRKEPPKPIVTIVKPTSSPSKTNKTNVSVIATVQNVNSSNEITVTADNGSNVAFTYNAATMNLTFEYNLTTTFTTFTVSAVNAGGSDSKTVTFKYEQLQNTATEDLITICHYPNGPNSTPQTIQISTNAWPAHAAHGDTQGPCPTTNGNGNNGNNGGNGGNGGNNGNGNNNNNNNNGGDNKGGTGITPKTVTPITTPKITTPKTESTPTTTPKTETTPRTVKPEETKKEETKKEETKTETTPSASPAPRVIRPQ